MRVSVLTFRQKEGGNFFDRNTVQFYLPGKFALGEVDYAYRDCRITRPFDFPLH